jgi:hypothetical protein
MTDMVIGPQKFRLQSRVDACLERAGCDHQKAAESSGIGISYGFARDLVRTLEHAERELFRLRQIVGEDPWRDYARECHATEMDAKAAT